VVCDDYMFVINMKVVSPMGFDMVALLNNVIFDLDLVKLYVIKEDLWVMEWLKWNIVSIGFYMFVKNEFGVEIVMEVMSNYWCFKFYFECVVLKFVLNEVDCVLFFKCKVVDLVVGWLGLSSKNVKVLEGETVFKVFSVSDMICYYFCMNEKKLLFDNKLVR